MHRRVLMWGLSGYALTACAQRGAFAPVSGRGRSFRQITMATNADGPGFERRGNGIRWFDVSVSVPSTRQIGTVPVSGPSAFGTERLVELPGTPSFGLPAQQPLVLWVHGYNNTRAEAVYRHVQMVEDIGMTGPQVSFVWPSASTAGGYLYDRDSVLDARRPLAEVIRALRQRWSGEILVVAHSLGAFLAMESFGRLTRGGKPLRQFIDFLLLLQPDIDPDVFAEQVRDVGQLPARSVVVLAQDDRALRLSGTLAGTGGRVGNSPASVPEGFRAVDLTGIDDATTSHLVALSSPQMLATLRTIYQRSFQ